MLKYQLISLQGLIQSSPSLSIYPSICWSVSDSVACIRSYKNLLPAGPSCGRLFLTSSSFYKMNNKRSFFERGVGFGRAQGHSGSTRTGMKYMQATPFNMQKRTGVRHETKFISLWLMRKKKKAKKKLLKLNFAASDAHFLYRVTWSIVLLCPLMLWSRKISSW